MSYNTAKIINVFYKEDRKPYDVNGKAISYFGEDFIGSNDATKIRFYFLPNQALSGLTGIVHAKRADGEVRFEILSSSSDDLGNYFELTLNAWFALKVGKVTLSLKVYSGEPTYGMTGDVITSIESVTGLTIVASDIFSFNVGYAPNATEVVPPFEDGEFEQLLVALGDKPDFGETIYVVSELPADLSQHDEQWFLVKSPSGGNIGKLYHINLPDAEEVELGVGQLNMTPSGNGDVVAGSVRGQVKWNADLGTLSFGIYDDVEIGAGDTLFWFVKADGNIAKGDVVQFAGNVGGEILVKKAVFAEITAQPDLLMGVAKHAIVDGNKGYIISAGRLNNINTDSFTTPILYLSTTTAGLLTSTKPTSGFKGSISAVGRFSTGGGSNGFLLVRPNLIKGVGELTDVTLTTTANGDVLRWNGTQWVNNNGLTIAEGEIDTLQEDVDNLESRMTTAENDIDQAQTDIIDLEDRITFVEVNGGIDFVKVDDFASLPTSGDVRNHRLFLTEDTKKLYEFDGTTFNEVRQDTLTADSGEADGFLQVGNGTLITHSANSNSPALQVFQTSEFGTGAIITASNDTGVQFAVNKNGSVNAYGDLTIAGNLTVSGTTTTVNTQTLDVEDNIITINKNQTGTPETTLLSGIEVERGDQTNFQFVFQESSDLFKVGQVGDLQAVATREDTPTDKGVAFFNTSTNKFETSGNLKVNTSGQLEDVTIRNSAVGVAPLIVDGITSTTADLQSWRVNNSEIFRMDSAGWFRTNTTGLANSASLNRAYVSPSSTGTVIVRNVADGNNALTVNLANASSTGNIANFQFAGANKLEITKDGFLTQNGARLFHRTGEFNTFFGIGTGRLDTTGPSNSAFGDVALESVTTGGSNTSVGRRSLRLVSTGSENTAIGTNAGNTITTGSQNTFLGRSAGFNASQLATANNSTAIGFESFTDASNQMVFGNASVTEFKFDRNASSKALFSQVLSSGANYPIVSSERTSTSTNQLFGTLRVAHKSSGDMVDGFGSSLNFVIVDNANADNFIGDIGARRSGADNSGRLVFQTNNAGTITEKMTIMPNGNVGIGTSIPVSILSVNTGTGVTTNVSTALNGSINFGNGGSTQLIPSIYGKSNSFAGLLLMGATYEENVNGDVVFNARKGDNTDFATLTNPAFIFTRFGTSLMSIRRDGNVGIGTTTPAHKLVVQSANDVINGIQLNRTGGSFPTNFLFYNPTSTTQLRLYTNIGGDRDILSINTNGLVGINETSPSAQLQVKSGATTRVPLIVDTLASHADDIQQWRLNAGTVARVDVSGGFRASVYGNFLSRDNALVSTANTGTIISRNLADGNHALTVNLANASSTGNITVFQKNATTLSTIANNGVFVGETRARRTDITANATLALVDEGKVLRVNSASNLTLTIPLNSSVAFPIDTEIAVLRYGTGTVSISPTSGVTLNSKNAERKISGQYGSVALKKIGTDEWVLVGSLEA